MTFVPYFLAAFLLSLQDLPDFLGSVHEVDTLFFFNEHEVYAPFSSIEPIRIHNL